MAGQELTGNYTYRSYLDLPEPVDDFNRLRFAELDLRLSVDSEGIITGALVLSDSPGAEPLTMEINGQVSEGSSPPTSTTPARAALAPPSPTSTTSTTGSS